jgi:nucleoside-diphosphate-sugar epimerase
MARRVVVTGSEGFVGKHLRAALEARGCEVVGIDRPGTRAELPIDLSEPSLDALALARRAAEGGPVDSVIYMAATITRGSSVDAQARSNLRAIAEAPLRLLEALAELGGPPHFVYCSTYKSYGPPLRQPIDPQCPPQHPDPWSYGSAKSLAEALLEIGARRAGGRYAIVRPTCIYGPGQHLHNAIPTFLRAAWARQHPVVFGSGQSVRDDVLASDLSYCLAEAALRRAEGAFHAGGERAMSILEVARRCCRAVAELGGPRGLEPAIDGSRPPKWWIDQEFDLSRSRELLGYEPTPLLDGLKYEARWLADGARPEASVACCPPPRTGAPA